MNTLYKKNSPFEPVPIEICVNACEAFNRSDEVECSFCFESRYVKEENGDYVVDRDGKKIASRIHNQLPITPQLASIFTNPGMIQAINTNNYVEDDDSSVIKNIFNQSLFKRIREENIISGDHDLFLALYVDGFQSHKRGGTKLTIIMLHILNLPEAERYLYS